MIEHVNISVPAKFAIIPVKLTWIVGFWNLFVPPIFYSECMVWRDTMKK